jgi:hypothetical protein
LATNKCSEAARLKSIEDRQARQDTKQEQTMLMIINIDKNTAILPDLKEDIKVNTQFRLKASGVIAFVAFSAATFGAGVVFIVSKVISKLTGGV